MKGLCAGLEAPKGLALGEDETGVVMLGAGIFVAIMEGVVLGADVALVDDVLNPIGGPIAAKGLTFAYAANPPPAAGAAAGLVALANPSDTLSILKRVMTDNCKKGLSSKENDMTIQTYFLVASTSSGALFQVSCLALSETSLSISCTLS